MQATSVEKSFCTTKEASLLLGVSVGTVQLWVESGLLQAWKTAGGHRRVLRDSVERLLHKSTPPAAAAPALPVARTARKLEILVVEDDTNLLRLYQFTMAAWPMAPRVNTLDNAFSALLLMGRNPPDLLITDLNMPSMDGFDMLKVLAQVPEMARTRIVVVTGLDADAVAARGGLPPRVELLPKPVPFARLQAIAQTLADEAVQP